LDQEFNRNAVAPSTLLESINNSRLPHLPTDGLCTVSKRRKTAMDATALRLDKTKDPRPKTQGQRPK